MLFRKRQADDRDREQDTKNEVRERDPDPAQENPDDIENGGQTARIGGHVPHMLPEWEECHDPDFETLDTEGDADDRQAQCEPGGHVFDKNDKSAENKPDDVSDEVHERSV